MATEQEKNAVRAVERALDILLCFTGTEKELGLSDIAKKVGLHKSTVYRLLLSLESRGFLRKHPQSEKYRLGWSILELVSNVYQEDDLATMVLPEITRLRDAVGETISVYIRSGNERVRVQAVESTQPVRRVANVGKRLPLHVGASGKVLLSCMAPAEIERVLDEAEVPHGPARAVFYDQLEFVRQHGYSVSIEEREPGAAAVAAPIFDRGGTLAAALSISGPVDRFTAEAVERFAIEAKQTAKRISKMLAM
jgi:IclR family KDG regulon transcriptional repressor